MDLKLEGIGGIEATRQIHQILPTTHILVLTMFDDESALAALRAGARGYLLKADDVERTIEAIYAVARGERRYSKSIEDRIHRTAIGLHATEPKPLLTARQLEVLQLIAIGLSNSEIATRLTIDERTVRNKVSDIYDALHLTDKERNRRYAILRAIEYRLI
jgi:DNA-binding NarL/FixJ family response regulator